MKDFISFFRLSRPLNVFITLLAFSVACFLAMNRGHDFIFDRQYYLACVALALIAGAGYWINDVFDFKIDQINKPERVIVGALLSQKKVLTAYFVASSITLVFSFLYQYPLLLSILNMLSMALLFFYAWIFKRTSVIGNLVIALLTCMVVLYAGVLYGFNWSLRWMAIFAFEITFIREVTKDVEDIRGDLKYQLHTLPIQAGVKGAQNVLLASYLVFIFSCNIPFFEQWIRWEELNWWYLVASILLVQTPAVVLMGRMLRSKSPPDFTLQSRSLKYLIFTGLLTTLLLHNGM